MNLLEHDNIYSNEYLPYAKISYIKIKDNLLELIYITHHLIKYFKKITIQLVILSYGRVDKFMIMIKTILFYLKIGKRKL